MAAFTIYKSTDTSAPILTGEVGKLVDLLQACLVDGYGSQVGAGWTAAFTGVTKTAFRPGAGTRFYFRVQDDGFTTAKEARITGYEVMTDVDNGTELFPAVGQGVGAAGYLIARKSASADNVPRDWVIVADSRTMYAFIKTGDTNLFKYMCFSFGDIYSLLPADAFHCLITGRIAEDNASDGNDALFSLVTAISSTTNGNYMARNYAGTGGSRLIGKHTDAVKCPDTGFKGNVPYPNPSDGAAIFSRVWIHDLTPVSEANNLRGRLRGIWCPCHDISNFADGDIIVGSGELAGKTFLLLKPVYNLSGVVPGVAAVEISNTVETN